jgi:hypothetical protein
MTSVVSIGITSSREIVEHRPSQAKHNHESGGGPQLV